MFRAQEIWSVILILGFDEGRIFEVEFIANFDPVYDLIDRGFFFETLTCILGST